VPAAWLAGVRAIVHSEHGRELADPEGLNARRNRCRRLLAPLIDRIVTVSDDLKAWLEETVKLPGAKLLVIPNGVDTERFSPARRLRRPQALQVSGATTGGGTAGRPGSSRLVIPPRSPRRSTATSRMPASGRPMASSLARVRCSTSDWRAWPRGTATCIARSPHARRPSSHVRNRRHRLRGPAPA